MGQITFRAMERGDIERILAAEYANYTSNKTIKNLEKLYDDQERGLRTVIIAERDGELIGRVTLLHSSSSSIFKYKNIPEVMGLTVIEKYQRQGIGTELMNRIEAAASELSDTVCLNVALCETAGAAQILFAKRGYIPDGSGLWYGRQIAHKAGIINDVGSLTLCVWKKLR